MITSIPGFKPVDDGMNEPTKNVAPQVSDVKAPAPEIIPAVAPKPMIDVLRTDGPTLAEWTKAGYPADKYPPTGYAVRAESDPAVPAAAPGPTDEQISAEASANIAELEKDLAAQLLRKAQHGGV